MDIGVRNGEVTFGTPTIPKGAVESGLFTIQRTPGETGPLIIGATVSGTSEEIFHSGYTISTPSTLEMEVDPGVFLDKRELKIQELQGIRDSRGMPVTQGSDKYTVALDTDPGGTVTITLVSLDTNVATLETQQLTFTSADWSELQDVNVTIQYDDNKVSERTAITHTISGYAGVPAVSDMPVEILDNEQPIFTEGETPDGVARRTIAENPAAGTLIGPPVSATDNDNDGEPDELLYTYSQTGNQDRERFTINKDTGQLRTKAGEIYDYETEPVFRIGMLVNDGRGGVDSINVIIRLTDVNDAPVFSEGDPTTRSLPENSGANVNVGDPVSATDQDRSEDTLVYSISGTDAGSFEIVESSGQLTTKQGTSYDYEAKASYSVTVKVSDGAATAAIAVTVNLTDVNEPPTFTEGESATRSLAENTPAGENVGAAVSATDQDGNTLIYTLTGTDAGSFEIDDETGQLTTKSGVSYDYEAKASYAVTVEVIEDITDNFSDTIAVTVNLTDANDAPVFTEGDSTTRSLPENSGANVSVGLPLAATDQDRNPADTLTYTLGGTDANSFEIVASSGQLTTKSGVSYDLETKASYAVTVTATDPDSAADSIAVTVNLTDVNDAPTFTDGDSTTRSVPENSGASVNVGAALAATDQDNDTLTYTLSGTDSGSFEIVASSGQLTTKSGVSYDLEAKASYTVTVTATDPDSAADSIAVTINLTDVNDAPTFTEGESATRSVPENSGANVDVGAAVSATDQDRNPADTLTYTLSGTDAGSFEIVASSGQLTTKSGVNYDLETKASYTVTVTATDPDSAADSIAVTVNLTDANDAPTFTEGENATRSLAENTAAGENVGAAVSATDQDNDTLTYTLGGTDAGSFEIVASSGQLQTKSGVSYDLETKASYSVTVTATDPDSAADSIAVTVNLTDANDAPVFTEGDSTTRSLAENSGANVSVGAAVSATDQDRDEDGNPDTLTYTLMGTDAGSFEIVESSGQLTTKSGVSYDYEAKSTYSVTVEVMEDTTDDFTDTIAVTVNLTDANDAPVFTEGESATRSLPENSGASVSVGDPVTATDQDNDTLTYTLGGTDANSFEIVASSGQLTTKSGVSYDLETKASYSVTVGVEDPEGGSDSIAVTINLTDVNDAPTFTEGESATRSLPENSGASVNVGAAVSATDQDGDTLTYTLTGTDATSFEIVASSGQLQTKSGVSYDLETKASYMVTVGVSDGTAADSIAVTINLTDVNDAPTFSEGDSTTRSLPENTAAGQNVGAAVSATDQDRNPEDTLTYTLTGTDAGSFEIVASSGQLTTKSGVSYDLETKASYSVTVTATDPDSAADTIAVTINLTDVNDAPVFTEGESATRSLAENSGANVNVGAAVSATDQDGDTLTYTLSGTDAGSFEIVASSGQLTTKSGVSYDLEAKASYTVTVGVSDGTAADSIAVTINLTDVNDAPTFTEGESATRSLPENSGASVNVGLPLAATDQDNDTLTYTLGGTDAASFEIDGGTGLLTTKSGVSYDLETKASYSVTVTATDPDSAADSIAVTINLTDVNDAPTFTEGESAVRSLAENTAADQNVGAAVSATDQDNDTLTYTLSGTDAGSFEIVASSGQLTTKSGVSYDLEAKASYSVTVGVEDPEGGSDSITVTINLTDVNDAPVFTEGESATRSLAENTAAGQNVGAAVSATDQDNDTLTYSLSGDDAGSFEIDGGTGQLTTKSGVSYDLETKASYSVTVTATDPDSAADTIAVTINLTDVNDAPTFTEGDSTTRSLPENSEASVNVGAAVSATDQDRNPADTLTYTLTGTDAGSFEIVASSGQLTTKSEVTYDYEAKASYSVTVTATDPDNAADTIAVTINLTDVNDAPTFTEDDSATRSLAENTAAGENVGAAVSATDQDNDTLTYTLSGDDAGSFTIVNTTGQLRTSAALDFEAKSIYSVTVTATDPDSAADTIVVTINLTDENERPDPPTNLRARPTDNAGEVLLEWTPPASNTGRPPITKYEVWVKEAGSNDWSDQTAFTTGDPPPSTLTITHLETGQKYDFRVRTVNHEGVSEWAESTASGYPKKPVVTITDKPGTGSPITEGADIGFLITADPYNNVPLEVKIKVETTGEYGITERNTDDPWVITIPGTVLGSPSPPDPHDSGTISTDNDEIDEENGSVTYTIIAAEAYDVGEPKSLTIAIEDNDERKIEVGAISGTIPENGGTVTYSVILTSEPTDNVTVTPSSSDGSIATVSGALTFTPEDWNTEQDVTVTGVNDDIDNEGDSRTATITHTVAGGDYGSVTAENVTVTVTDDDTRGITTNPTEVTVAEDAGTTSYTVVLDSQPIADVTVTLEIAEVEGTDAVTLATTGTLTFTNTNWGTPQTVELTVTDDSFDNTPSDRRTATITHTANGGDYGSVSETLTVIVTDDDGPNAVPSFDGTATTRDLPESIGAATDTGGTPIGNPVIAGDADTDDTLTYSLSGTDVDFFEIDTATGQLKTKAGATYDHEEKPRYTVTVSVHDGKAADGRPDASIDDDITVTINITDEVEEPNRPPAPTIETTGNSDSLRVIPNAPDNTGRPEIDEYDLQYRPKDSVEAFALESSIGGQGHIIGPLLLNTEYEVQVRARNDEGTGDWSESATQRTGTATATIIATPRTINESGATSRSAITARLDGQLTQEITLTVSATPVSPAEASDFALSENVTLTIAAGQMDSSNTVTVTAQDNQVDNDDRTVNVGATSATANLTINGAAITIQDDDTRGITATPGSNVTTEAGGTVTVEVKLNSQPTTSVTIGVESSNTDEGTVSPVGLTFTTGNWNTAQDLTVTGQDDSVDDGDIEYAITFTAASPDPRYEGQQASVELTNTDDDTRSVEITTTSTTDPPTLRVSEIAPGNTASYTVVLTSQPSDGNVTITPVSNALGNATVSAALIFTPQNWNTAQPVTITAVDDLIDNEADRTATITHTVTGADYGSNSVVAGSIEVTVTDNDEKGVTVSATELTVEETGNDSYTIVLNSQPTGTVTVTPAEGGDHPDAIAITPPVLTFTTGNWNNAQTVTVTGQRDHVDNEADRTAAISHSAGGDYTGITITGVEVTITDSDTAHVTLEQIHSLITEGQQSGDNPVSYTVVLDSKPRTGHVVKINITVAGPADTDPSSLTFTRENWNVPQSIRVTAHDDGVVSVLQTAVVSHQIVDAESSPEYGTVAVDDVRFDIVEDDHAPVFGDGESAEREVPENSVPGVNVGAAVEATDGDSDTLTYTLTGTDSGFFRIDEGTGQITTQETSYDFETKPQYAITVTASDIHGNTDTIPVTINLTDVNDAPTFSDGESTIREVPENSGANVEVGAPLSATDQDRPVNSLVYSLTGTDAESFDIDGGTGQLTTKSGVSYDLETKASYSVTVTATDPDSAADTIAVTVNLTDVNDAPVFTEGDSTTRSLAENSGASVNVGAAVAATDQDNDTLTYTLGGADAVSFEIDGGTGQLTTKQGVSYDLETKASYTVTVGVSDGTASDSITVTVNLTDVNDAPVFSDGDSTTRSLPENSGANVNVGLPLSATDQDNDTLTYTLSGTDAGSFEIVASSGQLTTKSGVSYDLETKASYTVTVTATDPDNAADTITVTINLTDANDAPVFTEGESATRSLPENSGASVNVGAAVSATDQDGDTLTYTLGGTDAAAFEIVVSSGQLTTKQGVSYDLEAKASYSVTVGVSDGTAVDTIAVTINLTDANDAPTFTEGESATRSLAENTPAGENVGAAVSATDQDGHTLTYTLSGDAAGSFEIDDGSGQLTTKSGVTYNYEAKASYTVTVTVADPDSAADTIAVTVNLTDVNDAPTFTDGDSTTRSLPENSGANVDVGAAVSATDQDGDTLTYTLSGTDASSFEIVASSGQLTTKQGVSYDLEAKASYSVTVTAADPDTAADTIAVTINLTDVNDAPTFTEGDSTTRSVPENSGASVNVGAAVSATDQDGDTLTYTLSGDDAGSFEIVASSGQLTTKSGVSYDLETKASYSVTVTAADPDNAADSIAVTINLTDVNDAPVFTEGESATRSLAENTAAGQNVGAPVSAMDQDRNPADTLTYTLTGTDAGSFEIDGGTGQLTTKSGVSYDLEAKSSYSVTVTATDPDNAADTIAVTINLTDVNDAPTFTEGDTAIRSLAENSGANVDVGLPLAATDQDGNTLTYTLSGTDAGSFEIVASSGQLTTKSGVSYDLETKASYTVTVTATDPDNAADTIAVTINLTDVNDAPVFTEGASATRSVPENSGANVNVGAAVAATDQDRPADTLTYTLTGTDAGSFEIVASSGQLRTKSGVNYDLEAKASYTVTVTATDPDSAADTIAVTVNLTDVNDAPTFTEGESATRSVPENSGASVNVGAAVSATDQDGNTLAYTLGGDDAGSFEIVESSGQLTTKQGVNYDLEAKASYSVTVTATDPDNAADSIAVTVNLTDVNDAPTFTEGDSATRSVPENSVANVNVGAAVSATDQDRNPADTLAYTLGGDDAGSFDIDGGTGQLTTKQGVSYDLEAKASYTVTVTATDPDNAADSIPVTINLTDANDAPTFTEGESATRSLAENTAAGQNVGDPVSATDQDGDTLTYTLSSTDADSFDIAATTGQLQTKSGVSYDYEDKQSYSVTVGVSDGSGGSDSIAVTVNLTDVNEVPTFNEGDPTTRSLAENTPAGENIGAPVTATDPDGGTLTYALSGTDAGSFDINADTGQLTTKSGVTYDYEAKQSYSVTVGVRDPQSNADTIAVTVNLTNANDAPVFTEGESATRSLAENTAAGQNVGLPLSATDQDGNTLTYTLSGTDAGSFEIVASSGQLTTKSGVSYDLEAKASYSVTVGVSDGTAADTIAVTVNLTDANDAPVFTEGESATRSLAENTAAGQNVGLPLTATDQDGNTLTYTLTGTDAASFDIAGSTGQLRTKSGVTYDYEAKASYSVTVGVSDGTAADSIAVTVNLIDVNDPARGLTVVPQTVREDAGAVQVTVRANGLTTRTYTCWADTADSGTTVSAADFMGLETAFAAGQTLEYSTTTTRTVNVTVVNDAVDENTEALVIRCKLATDVGGTAAGTLTIQDDDTRGFDISTSALRVTEGQSGVYTVVLASQPTADSVIVTPSSSNPGAATVSPASLTFTTANWNHLQTMTVSSPEDDDALHAEATITHSVSAVDTDYAGLSVPPVAVTVSDNDVSGYLSPDDRALSYNEPFWLSLPEYHTLTRTTTKAEMRDIMEEMWEKLPLPSDLQTTYSGIDAHNSVLCWQEVRQPSYTHTWPFSGMDGAGTPITNPSVFDNEAYRYFFPVGRFQLRAPAVRHDTTLTFRLTVRPGASWLDDRECLIGVTLVEVQVPVKSTTVGFAETVGTIPTVLLQPGNDLHFDVKPYFGPDPDGLSHQVASVWPAGVATARLRGAGGTPGLAKTDVIVEALADGEAVVAIQASAYGGATATQAFRVIVGDNAAVPITYAPDTGRDLMTVDLYDLLPGGAFDYTYKEWREGEYRPYQWRWEQLSGPTVSLFGFDHELFGLPDFPEGTLLKFRVTASQSPVTLALTGQRGKTPETRSFDLLLRVGNPGNTRPLGQPVANAGPDTSASTGTFLALDGTNSVSPTGSWTDLDFRWEVESAPNRVLTELRNRIANSYEKGAYNGPYIAYFDMPQLYAGEALVFKLTTTIWGQTSTDTVRITSSNPLPVANAGPDREQDPGERVVLQGSGSLNPQVQDVPVEYAWTQLSEPTVALSDETTANPWFVLPENAPAGQALQFELTVTDQEGQSDSDTVTVTVREVVRPTANAGPDLTGAPGESVTLQGTNSENPYGKWYQMAHAWTQLSGPAVTLSDATVGDPTFTLPDDAENGVTLEFQLTVTDQEGDSDSDTMTVTVVMPEPVLPTACAGPDLTGAAGDEVTLEGRCSINPYGKWYQMAHSWTQLSGPTVALSDATVGNPSFTLPSDAADGTTLEFQLTVTDQEGESDSDTMIVTIAAPGTIRPTANAGPDLTGAPGESVTLQGTGSTNPYGEWWRMEHAWTQLSGPTVTLSDATVGNPTFTLPEDAADGTTLEFELTVTDKEGVSDSDTVTVTVAAAEPENTPPTFDEGDSATRSRPENAAAGQNVGAPLTATDLDGDTLTYTLSGEESGSFEIDAATGQLMTKQGVSYDYETKSTYSLTVTAEDPDGATASISVTVNLTDANDPPAFDAGPSAAFSLPENTAAGENVGLLLTATDQDGDTLTYSLSSDDAGAFDLNAATRQLTTGEGVAYDYEEKATYSVTITAEDGNDGTAAIEVTVNLTDVNEPPAFDDGTDTTREVAENSGEGQPVGAPLTATDPDEDTLTYSLSGDDAGSFDLNAATGQLTTGEGVSYEYDTKSTYAVTVTAEDPEGASASINVTVTLVESQEAAVNNAPVFDEGTDTTRSLAENTAAEENVGLPLTATDPDEDTLTYTLSGDDAESFDIDGGTGQLTTREGVAYDYETQATYAVTVTAEDGNDRTASISVTVNLTDANDPPAFDAGPGAAFSLPENTAAGQNVGAPLTATDQDGDTLTYTLSGDDADSFDLNAATGQLTTGEGVAYDYEEKATYSVTITAEDGNDGTAAIEVTVNLTDVNEPPAFDDGTDTTREVAENSGEGQPVGAPLTATDPDEDTLTYSLSGDDAGSFDLNAAIGQLTTKAGVSYEYDTKSTYAVTVTAEDPEGASASINVTVTLVESQEAAVNNAPVFDEGPDTTRSLAENTAAEENVGLPLTATDPDEDTLTYTLSGDDAESFDLNAATGQLVTKEGVTYDYETQASYSIIVTADDPNGGTASILVTVNLTDVDETPPDTAPTVSDTSQLKNHAATVGQPFSVILPAADEGSGNGEPYEYILWKRGAGVHFSENGLTFDATTREVSGTPSAAGTFLLAYQVHDGDDNRSKADSFVAETNLQITVAPPPDTAPTVSDTSQFKNHEATVGQPFSVVLPAADAGSGNGEPYEYILWHQGQGKNFMDQAINGLRFDPETRTLAGTPEEAGVWQLSYVIHDADDNRSVEDRFRERDNLRVTVSE